MDERRASALITAQGDALRMAARLIDQHARKVLPPEYVRRFDKGFGTAPLV